MKEDIAGTFGAPGENEDGEGVVDLYAESSCVWEICTSSTKIYLL